MAKLRCENCINEVLDGRYAPCNVCKEIAFIGREEGDYFKAKEDEKNDTR